MSFSRVKAVYIEDTVEMDDVLVFDAYVNTDNSVREMEIFGYAIEYEDKWPIYIRPKEKEGLLNWGPGEEGTNSTINLFQKKMVVGEYITRVDIYDAVRSEYTYRIVEIFDWSQLR